MRTGLVTFLHVQYEPLEPPKQFPRTPMYKGIYLLDSLPYPKDDDLHRQLALDRLSIIWNTDCDDDKLCS